MKSTSFLSAFAKINLDLKVLNKRDDGYHNIESIIVFLNLSDTIKVKRSSKLSVNFDSPFEENISQKNNTIIKIYEYFLANYPNLHKYSIHVDKKIPISAGLGGGSADAASFMRFLIKDNNINPNDINLDSIAKRVGADIPVCYTNYSARVSGLGEHINRVSINFPLYALIVYPNISMSTKWVFENFMNKKTDEKIITLKDDLSIENLKDSKNDLQDIVVKKYPIINDVIDKIIRTRGCIISRMTGSGSTCFGLYKEHEDTVESEKYLRTIYPNFWIKSVRIKN